MEGVDYNGAWPRAFSEGDRIVSLRTSPVSGGLFDALGTRPALGRLLRPEDDVVGAEPVVVLSHGAWRRLYGSDPDVLGRRLVLHGFGVSHAVVGVAPPGLEYPAGVDAWIPVVPFGTFGRDSTYALLHVVGRLAPGVSAAAARAEFETFLRQEVMPTGNAPMNARDGAVHTLPVLITGDVRPILLAVAAAVGLLLLIACINVGNLLLVRAMRRSREIALRRALGAGYPQIVRHLLSESAVLAVLGGVAGLILAHVLLRTLVAIAPPELPQLDRLRLAGLPLGIATTVTLASTILFGLAPALWAARSDLANPLRAGGRAGDARSTQRARPTLVTCQVALALMVLAAAGLVSRSLARLQQLDMGFDVADLAILEFAWPWTKYDSVERVRALFDELTPAVRAIDGVEHVTPILITPFSGTGGWDGHFMIEGQSAAEAATNPYINLEVAGPDYFATFETPMLRGRGFTAADREGAPRVVVVNQAVAQRFWPGEEPTGKRVALHNTMNPDAWLTVVGVAGETRYRALREPAPTIYFPFAQSRWAATMMAVRTADAAVAVIPAVRRAITDAAPDVLVWRAETMEQLVARQLAQPRTGALLLAAFIGIALLLAAIGIYGVVMLAVRHRTTELGVRLALGALPAQVRRLVLRDALIMIATGAAFGLAGAIAGTRLLGSLLFDVSPTDPLTLAAVCFVLLGVGLAAAYAPAGRATRIDPAAALRSD